MRYYLSPPPPGPIARFIAAVFALCVMAGLMFFGIIALVIVVALIGAWFGIAWLRLWWLGRKPGGAVTVDSGMSTENSVIDAEYKVISRKPD